MSKYEKELEEPQLVEVSRRVDDVLFAGSGTPDKATEQLY